VKQSKEQGEYLFQLQLQKRQVSAELSILQDTETMKQQHVIGNVSIDYRELRDRPVREHGAVFHHAALDYTSRTQ
jgi:hypothetical protein